MMHAVLALALGVIATKKVAYTPATTDPSALVRRSRAELAPQFDEIDWRTRRHVARVMDAFREQQVTGSDFAGVDGYGHGDIGREKIDAIYARLFGAEAALVRVQMFSGTHAIACALYGVLRPGDTLLTVSGQPYDTLEEVIGTRSPAAGTPGAAWPGLTGSLAEFGVKWEKVELCEDGSFDYAAIREALERPREGRVAMVHVQRSCGYQWRRSIPVAEIGELADWLKAWRAERDGVPADAAPAAVAGGSEALWQPQYPVLFVDNCYGEFVEELEPTALGADLVAGSLIKNPGGTLAPTGGYVAGRAALVQAASNRLSAPGVEGGATLGMNRLLLQGLFHAPQVVGEALKGATLAAHVLAQRGFKCSPAFDTQPRSDIVQCVELGSRENLVAFCQVVQRYSPVNAHVRPTAGSTPGYGDEVVFADGTFIEGSTAELSADGPLREPYVVYMQGANHWTQWAIILDAFLHGLDADESS
ncbi:cystathionine beta-lyase family protein [Pavlovales sp. CCMP2436]|nr:cystathionine beta-lyase family protein [Pavlovales sp. CCMP2436]